MMFSLFPFEANLDVLTETLYANCAAFACMQLTERGGSSAIAMFIVVDYQHSSFWFVNWKKERMESGMKFRWPSLNAQVIPWYVRWKHQQPNKFQSRIHNDCITSFGHCHLKRMDSPMRGIPFAFANESINISYCLSSLQYIANWIR